jgi:hypothetical protein
VGSCRFVFFGLCWLAHCCFACRYFQSKSARVTDLEAELLLSHKYANSMQNEMHNIRASPSIMNSEQDELEVRIDFFHCFLFVCCCFKLFLS